MDVSGLGSVQGAGPLRSSAPATAATSGKPPEAPSVATPKDELELSAAGKEMLWIPPGFAHGFVVLSAFAQFLYKATDYWYPEHERTLLWNDPALRIAWPLAGEPQLAPKDAAGRRLAECELFP